MILLFPNEETFRLVLTGGLVPSEVLLEELQAAFTADGQLTIETTGKLPRKTATELTRLGVSQVRRHVGEPVRMVSWLQVLPLVREPQPPQLSSQAPVLFELEAPRDLPSIVGEMLRLGNDRQSVRWLASATNEERVLLRVIGPPYYTLLRAIDQTASGASGTIRAYLEQAPRVWVQLGYQHPFATQVRVEENQLLLLRPPRDWEFLPEAPFRDVYEVLQFQLPAAPVDWSEAAVTEKLVVPLRLVAGNAADVPELWVLRGDAAGQLDAFVRDADERLTQRLKFAVATAANGETVIVLRVTASKLPPPVLPLVNAVGFKPYYKLPNLYIPAGSRLHPTLRRDAVRKLLAEDTDQLVWLYPGPDGRFTPETLPEDSFRPLEDWVDYVIETNHAPLAAWVEATQFDFEHFVCADGHPPRPPRDPGEGKGRRRTRDAGEEGPPAPARTPKAPTQKGSEPAGSATLPSFTAPPLESKPPSEWKIRLDALEKQFLALDGPLDMPERQALWPELAIANAGYNDIAASALCWVNSLWESEDAPPEWLDGWFRTEFPDLKLPITAAEFDRRMKPTDPTQGEIRQFAAMVFWLASQNPVPAWLMPRLPAVQHYLEQFERKLPMRLVWLVASRLAVVNRADTLGLARVRDRLLQRLLEGGINPETDLPSFLRYAGLQDSERARHIRDRALELHRDVRGWAEASLAQPVSAGSSDQGATLAYIDLFFAFGLAKLGEVTPARQLVASARQILERYPRNEDRGIVSHFLFDAFRYRVEQALAGKPHSGLLDPKLLETQEQIHNRAQGGFDKNNPYGLAHYVITRMREQSKILEPQEKLDPYGEWMRHGDELKKTLADLPRQKDPNILARTIRDLYRSGAGGRATPESRFLILFDALPLSARVGEQFTFELVGLVPEAMRASDSSAMQRSELAHKQGQLLERALFLAAHFDRREVVQQLVDQFIQLVNGKPEEQRYELINVVAAQCLRSLRKLGLRDEIDKLLHRMQEVVLGGQSLEQMRARYRTRDPRAPGRVDLWAKALQSLLHLAGGWMTFELTAQAAPILEDARAELIGSNTAPLQARDYTALAQAYVGALGQGPAESGLARISELFRKMDPTRIVNTFTTSKFYSRLHLNLVEETILAIVSDDFALGPAGRRWLDEDEYLVRRRIHRDMKRHLERSGL